MEGIKNCMEDWVVSCLNRVIDNFEGCHCDKCRKDICALALNHLQPYYVVTSRGEVMAKINTLQMQYETDILAAVVKAIKIVHQEVHHEK